jgi:hypothetical protein
MEIPADRARKIEGSPKEVSLTHESIIHLDVWNSNISAIVRHDKYVLISPLRRRAAACCWSTVRRPWKASTSSRTRSRTWR